jgi:hypothetical protein
LLSGAYDASTWGTNPDGTFTDGITHSANAQFWIPSVDEWGKAAFYDPNRFGMGQGGWWARVNSTDSLPAPGLPGAGGATTSTGIPQYAGSQTMLDIPLAAYPAAMSPWGLFDTSGGTTEVVEDSASSQAQLARLTLGAVAGNTGDPVFAPTYLDFGTRPFYSGTDSFAGPGYSFVGLRIAASVPAPSFSSTLVLAVGWGAHRRSTRHATLPDSRGRMARPRELQRDVGSNIDGPSTRHSVRQV